MPDWHKLVGKDVHLYMVGAVDLKKGHCSVHYQQACPRLMTGNARPPASYLQHFLRLFNLIRTYQNSCTRMYASYIFIQRRIAVHFRSCQKHHFWFPNSAPSSRNSSPCTGGQNESSNQRGIDQVDLANRAAWDALGMPLGWACLKLLKTPNQRSVIMLVPTK